MEQANVLAGQQLVAPSQAAFTMSGKEQLVKVDRCPRSVLMLTVVLISSFVPHW